MKLLSFILGYVIILKRFMNHMMSHHSYLIKLNFYTKQFVYHITQKLLQMQSDSTWGHAPDPLDLACYAC